MHRHNAPKTNGWSYSWLLVFFIQQAKMDPSGAAPLSIILEGLCARPKRPFDFGKIKTKIWPIIEKLNLDRLHFWHDLNSAIINRTSYLIRKPDSESFFLRYNDPLHGSRQTGQKTHFSPSGLDDDFGFRFTCNNTIHSLLANEEVPKWNVEQGKEVMRQMNALISLELAALISAGHGFFQFPSIGDDNFYNQCKEALKKEKNLRWNVETKTVSVIVPEKIAE